MPEGPYLVVGLARSGAAAARLLAERGERVIGVDFGRPAEAAGLLDAGVEVHLEVDGSELLDETKTVVKSPGVPKEAPVIAAARKRRTPVIGELEVAWRALPNRFCAVTGTNGKTTTTELIGELFRAAGEPVAVAGNVGTPLASLVGEVDEASTVICECSSFQLEDAESFAPECAVFLNLAPDHLDRHGSLQEYLRAKLRIFANQVQDDFAVYNASEPVFAELHPTGAAQKVRFCPDPERGTECELTLEEGELRWRGRALIRAEQIHLLGRHNVVNAMAAAAAALSLGVPEEAVAEGLGNFEGVPHRLEPVAAIDGVLYVNDSKATNVSAAIAAIESFEGGVHLILGGSPKGESFERLAAPIRDRCVAAYLIGEAAPLIEEQLEPMISGSGVPLERCDGLADAIHRAAYIVTEGQAVLLAPACASFDAYENFEDRGEHFRRLVEGLS